VGLKGVPLRTRFLEDTFPNRCLPLGVLWVEDLEVVGRSGDDLPNLLVGGPQVGMISHQMLPYLFGQGWVVFCLQCVRR
jgi:hypothetical protein